MATRFYLPASGTAPLGSLAVDSQWELSDNLDRRPCDVIKSNTSLTQKSANWTATATQQWVWVQFQSKRLAAGYSWTTSDTVSMVIKVAEAAAQVDSHLCYVIRVVSGDGSTIRGTIGAYLSTSTEYPTSLASIATRIHSARTDGATNFSSQAGDRIIIEIGHHGVTPTTNTVYHNYGDPSATSDYALTADLTTDLCPWVELSRNVSFDVTTNRSAYTKGRDTTSSNRAIYTVGANPSYPASNNRAAYLKGKADISNNRSIFTKGKEDTSSNRSAYTKGGINVTPSNMAVYVKGNQHTSSNSAIFAKGQDNISSNRSVYVEGASTGGDSASSRSVWCIGIGTLLIPDAVVGSSGTWLDQTGGSSDLQQRIDETIPNDNDYVKDTDPTSGHYIEFSLSDPSGVPGAGDIVVFWRGSDSSGLGHSQATVQLRQGSSTVIASQVVTLTTNPRCYYLTLTVGERASITDWNDLRIRILPDYV